MTDGKNDDDNNVTQKCYIIHIIILIIIIIVMVMMMMMMVMVMNLIVFLQE